MTLVVIEDLRKHYGAQEVLSGASLQIDETDRIGLVGPNGAGKSTLVKMITGLESPDTGKVQHRKGVGVGHVPQRPDFGPGMTTRSYVESGLAHAKELVTEFERLGLQMGEVEGDELDTLLERHALISERIDAIGAWDIERRVEAILSGIGLGESFWDREARSLSGGEKNRVALARELAAGHDLLLLDEPTNHLDLGACVWLEDYLAKWDSILILTSHSADFLNGVCSKIYHLTVRNTLDLYGGNYDSYVQTRQLHAELALLQPRRVLVGNVNFASDVLNCLR